MPVLASTITTIIVFFPVMFLFGVAKYLFSALSLAVVLSMLASYVVAMTRHPDLLRALSDRGDARAKRGGRQRAVRLGAFIRVYERFAARYERMLDRALDHKFVVIGAVAVLFVVSMLIYPLLGTELFPHTDAGQFIINFRAPRRHAHRDDRSS